MTAVVVTTDSVGGSGKATSNPLRHPGSPLLETLLQLDTDFHDASLIEKARHRAMSYLQELSTCYSERSGSDEASECFLKALLEGRDLAPAPQPAVPSQNTATTTLAEGRGSCAALIATVLALTEPFGGPFEAVVLREHVLLGSRDAPNRYYEVLEGGRPLKNAELGRYEPFPPGGPIRVGGSEYLAYYLDNLAARLAEADEPQAADETFQKALQLAPGAARVHYNYGTFLLQRDRFEFAEMHLTRAIRMGWKDPDAFVNRGASRWKLGRSRPARRDFERALKLDPGNRRAASNLRMLGEFKANSR